MHEPLDTKRLREYLATGKLSERQSLDGIAMDEKDFAKVPTADPPKETKGQKTDGL